MSSISRLKVSDIASTNVLTITADTSLKDAIRYFAERRISCLVVAESGHPVGIVTERDLLRLICSGYDELRPVSAVMSAPLMTARKDLNFALAWNMLSNRAVRHLVLVDESGCLSGVVSASDFRRHIGHDLFEVIQHLGVVLNASDDLVDPDRPLSCVLETMASRRLDHMVIGRDEIPLGIITERDIPRLMVAGIDVRQVPVSQVMSAPLLTAEVGIAASKAAELLNNSGLRHLVMLDRHGRFAGVISQHRLLERLSAALLAEERDHLAQQVEVGEQRFRLFIENMQLPLCHVDAAGNIIYLNQRCSADFGYTQSELPDVTTWWKQVCPDPRYRQQCVRRFSAAVEEARQTRQPIRPQEYRMTCKDGQQLIIEMTGICLDDELLLTYVDITERRRQQYMLQLQARRAQALLELPHLAGNQPEEAFIACGEQIAGELTESPVTFLHHVLPSGQLQLAWCNHPDAGHCETLCMPQAQWLQALETREPVISNQQACCPHSHGLVAMQRLVVVPVLEQGQVVMLAGAGNKHANYEQHDAETLQLVAHEIWRTLQRQRVLTALRDSEARLRESEQQFRLLTENAVSGIACHELIRNEQGEAIDSRILSANPAFERHTGIRLEDAIGQRISVLMPGIEKTELLQAYAGVVQTGEPAEFEFYSSFLDRHYQISAYRLGENRFANAFLDISDRRRAEAALRESEQHFRTLANGGMALIWTAGLDRQCNYFNEPWLRFTGRTLAQEVGTGWAEGVHPEDLPACMATYNHRFEQREAFSMEYRLCRADGCYRWIRDLGNPRHDSNGNFIGYIGFCYDITEQKLAEDQLRQSASVFEHANEGILITDAQARILDVNAAFTRITGYSRDEVIGRNPRLLKSGRQGREYYSAMWRALQETGHWSGEQWNRRKDGEVYAELLTISAVHDRQGEIVRYVGLFSDITPLKEHQKQLEFIAHYDALTSLPNRVLLADRLKQAMALAVRHQSLLAVVYLDLDGFKAINDNHGHDIGDRLLIVLAERMTHALRGSDTLSRLGGDEFVLVLLDLPDQDTCITILERLLRAVAAPVQINGQVLYVSASLGVSFYPQADNVDADQMLRQADQAMYQAKQAGKNRYHLFDAEQDRAVRGHYEDLERIRQALNNQELALHYQPKVNLRTGEVIGVEALIRWQHPQRGLLPPSAFLPLLEGQRLMLEVGQWVLSTALAQFSAWAAGGLHLPVSVNLHAMQLLQPDFVEQLRHELARHPALRPGDLELEVLETSALQDMLQVSHVIVDCQALGVSFSVDDFGTGYSSLTYLKRLPARLLKIDQSFVRDMLEDPDDLAILDGVLGLASAFQRQAIAEGVETPAHAQMLLRMGCELGQGYAIARPMPAAGIHEWLREWQQQPLPWQQSAMIERHVLPVLYAMVDHRAWVLALGRYLRGEQDLLPPQDQQQCRFGHWLHHEGMQHYASHPVMPVMLQLHQQIHAEATRLLDLYVAGDHQGARDGLHVVENLRDRLLEQLNLLLDHPVDKSVDKSG